MPLGTGCHTNPAAGIKELSEKGRARDVYLTLEECRALIDACCDDIRLIITIAIWNGLRRGEILGLRWSDLTADCTHALIRKEESKNLCERRLELGHSVRRGLQERAREHGATLGTTTSRIFPLTPNQLRWRYDKARYSCDTISKQKQKALCFHALRHTCASILRQGGLSLGDIMGVLGHGSYKMTLRYAHLGPEVGAKAAALMEKAFGENPKRRGRASGA